MSHVSINKKQEGIQSFGMTLMLATTRSLLTGREVDVVSWEHIGNECEAFIEEFLVLAVADDDSYTDIPSPIRILKQLTTIVLSKNLTLAREVADQIPNDSHFELPYYLGQAIVDVKSVNSQSQGQGSYPSNLGYHLWKLVSYAENAEEAKKALIYIFTLFQESIESCIKKEEIETAIYQASGFIIIATLLFTKYGLTEQLVQALSLSEQIVFIESSLSEKIQVGICALSHNIVNACLRWVQKRSADAQLYFERGLKVALHGRHTAYTLERRASDSNVDLILIEGCFSDVCAMQANLATTTPEQFDIYADSVWKSLQEYMNLATRYPDPDLEYRVNKLQQTIYLSLREARPDWMPPKEFQDITQIVEFLDERSIRALLEGNHLSQEEVRLLIDQINLLTDTSQQQKVINETLESWYLELEYSLAKIIAEVGLNHHVCRLLVALGAIAGGRLDPIAPQSIPEWIYRIEKDDHLVGEPKRIWQRQHMMSAKHFEEEQKVFLYIVKLATLASSLHQVPILTSFTSSALRQRNASLLEKVLPKVTYTHHDNGRKHTKADDLKLLLRKLPQEITAPTLFTYYQLALNIDQSSWSEDGPLSLSNTHWEKILELVMTLRNQEQKVQEQEMSSKLASEDEHVKKASRAEDEKDIQQASDNSDDSSREDFVFVTDFEENPMQKPEDLIGAELRGENSGKVFRVVEILGQGRTGVVFSIRSSDGDERALKVFHHFFDLHQNLREKVNRLLKSGQATPENILPVLNQIVQHFPDDAIAWFNRGAFLEEIDLAEALNCYNHAIELEPNDVSNYLKKGHVLLKMRCHQQAAETIQMSFEINKDRVRNYFVTGYSQLLEMIDVFKQETQLASQALSVLEYLIDIQSSIKQEVYTRIAYICDTVALALIVHRNDFHHLKKMADEIANMDNQDRVIQGASSLMKGLENLLRDENSQATIDQLPEDLSRKYTDILEQISVSPNTLEHLLVQIRLRVRRAIFGNNDTERPNIRHWLSQIEQNNTELMQEKPELQKFFYLLDLWLQNMDTNDQELELSDHYRNLVRVWKTP